MSIVLSDLTLLFGEVVGKEFLFNPWGKCQNIFLYFASEIRGNAVRFCLFVFCVWLGVLCPFLQFFFS